MSATKHAKFKHSTPMYGTTHGQDVYIHLFIVWFSFIRLDINALYSNWERCNARTIRPTALNHQQIYIKSILSYKFPFFCQSFRWWEPANNIILPTLKITWEKALFPLKMFVFCTFFAIFFSISTFLCRISMIENVHDEK